MKRRKTGLVNEDRISQLPDALILQILSLLPSIDAIATSALSKQWQSLWKMMPKLNFDYSNHKLELGTFSENVCSSLLSHKAPVLESLHLKFSLDRCNVIDTGILIGIAFARNVRKLVLEIQAGNVYRFPRSLYNCETLETLELSFSICMDVPSTVCFKSLRTLHLRYVRYKDEESVLNLLSGCPNLENLTVHRNLLSGANTFTVRVPSLQRLSIHNTTFGGKHWGYVINAPCLKYLKIQGLCVLGFCLIENTTKLVEANIIDVSHILDENILTSLSSVKRLSLDLSPVEIKFPTGIIFNQLVYLELHTYKEAWWNLLALMLDSSPKLQVLKLINQVDWITDLAACRRWNQPENVPECFLFHLETFMWKGYKWKQEDEKEVANYILRNANRLKKAIFSSKPIDSETRLEMVEELESVVRASNSCQLVFI